MNIHTPLPYSFATNRGTKSRLKLHDIDAPMHSASCNKPDLPRDTVTISRGHERITYRVQWSDNNWTYTQIDVLTHKHGYVWLTGGSPSITLHEKVMDTVKTLHPMVMQLFSS